MVEKEARIIMADVASRPNSRYFGDDSPASTTLPYLAIVDGAEIRSHTEAEFLETLKLWRERSGSLVMTSGSFDPIVQHHITYLNDCRTKGRRLLVGMDAGEKVRLRKGASRPRTSEAQSLVALAAVPSVDAVVLKRAEWPKWQLTRWVNPDTLVTTDEQYGEKDFESLSRLCGRLLVKRFSGGAIEEWKINES